jgi:hypothetical protein
MLSSNNGAHPASGGGEKQNEVGGVGPEAIKKRVLMKEVESLSNKDRTEKVNEAYLKIATEWRKMERVFERIGVDVGDLEVIRLYLKDAIQDALSLLSTSPFHHYDPESPHHDKGGDREWKVEERKKNLQAVKKLFVDLFKGLLKREPEWRAVRRAGGGPVPPTPSAVGSGGSARGK